MKVSPPECGGHKGIQPHHEGTMDFCSETIRTRAIPRNCPTLSSSSKNKPKKTPPAKSQWRKIKKKKKKRKLLKTASNFFFFLICINFLHKQCFAGDWLLQVGYLLSTTWSHCKVSKDAEYCIIYKDLKQGVFSVSICLLGSLGLFGFFPICQRGKKKPLQFFYL